MKVKTLNGNLNIIGRNLRKYRKSQRSRQTGHCSDWETDTEECIADDSGRRKSVGEDFWGTGVLFCRKSSELWGRGGGLQPFPISVGTEKGCYRRGTKSVYWNLSNGVSGRERGWRSSRRGSKYRCRVAIFHSADGSKKQKGFSYGLESVGGYRADTGDSFVRE